MLFVRRWGRVREDFRVVIYLYAFAQVRLLEALPELAADQLEFELLFHI